MVKTITIKVSDRELEAVEDVSTVDIDWNEDDLEEARELVLALLDRMNAEWVKTK